MNLWDINMFVDGKKIQQEIKEELKTLVKKCTNKPSLGIVLVGDDPASEKFVSLKQKFGEAIGVDIWIKILPESASIDSVIASIGRLETDGVVVQLPLPEHIDEKEVLLSIPKETDVDMLNGGDFVAPVAGAVFEILDRHGVQLENKKIVIVGNGKLVGLPTKDMFIHKGFSPSLVTLETSEEDKLKLLSEADIIVTGAGDPHFIKRDMVKKGVVIIDAGTSKKSGKLEGDACPSCEWKASLMTPVPGGVGPITIAILFRNLIQKCQH
jgi:methylenetetrahydrofolate dehydrogenase (NADP+) / methenyltetrahydrofolate cyclohydrolase